MRLFLCLLLLSSIAFGAKTLKGYRVVCVADTNKMEAIECREGAVVGSTDDDKLQKQIDTVLKGKDIKGVDGFIKDRLLAVKKAEKIK